MYVTALDVVAFLGPEEREREQITALATAHLPVVTAMVHAYVRGKGFEFGDPADDLAMVIMSSTARLTQNPEGMTMNATAIDDASMTKRLAVFDGWTLPELAVLHRYRKRAL